MCQFASIDISDMMGTERQGITKDITMTRLNSEGESLGVIDYTDDSLTYEELADTSEDELPCSVTLYEHDEFTGACSSARVRAVRQLVTAGRWLRAS